MKYLILLTLFLLSISGYTKDSQKIQLTGDNTVFLSGGIDPLQVDLFVSSLMAKRLLLPMDEKLYVLIISPGGEIRGASKIVEVLSNIPNPSVICKYCNSAAGLIFVTFKGQRLVTSKSTIVMHEMFLSHFVASEAEDPQFLADFIAVSHEFNQSMANVLDMKVEAYEKKITGTVWEVQGAELIKLHLADKLVKINCSDYITHIAPDTCSD